VSTAVTVLAWLAVALAAALTVYALRSTKRTSAAPEPAPVVPPARTDRGAVNVIRPPSNGVEGLEIQYQRSGIVRSVRVGAMNCEHKELLLTMDDVAWSTMPNAQKQEVLAAARSTWAAKMCPSGPDIAYVVVKTERGEIVGRASPRTVTII
jgi:hypothetical protein